MSIPSEVSVPDAHNLAWHESTLEEAYSRLCTRRDGLTSAEVADRRAPEEHQSRQRRTEGDGGEPLGSENLVLDHQGGFKAYVGGLRELKPCVT